MHRSGIQQTYLQNVQGVRITEPLLGPHGRWRHSSPFGFWSYQDLMSQIRSNLRMKLQLQKVKQSILDWISDYQTFTQSILSRVSLKRITLKIGKMPFPKLPSLIQWGMFLTLHFVPWDFNRAPLIALGHLLIASNTFKGIWGVDKIDVPD